MGKREYSSDRKADFENTLLEMMTQIPYSEITVASLIRRDPGKFCVIDKV